jgi:DNA polymerase-3 subunit epsilon
MDRRIEQFERDRVTSRHWADGSFVAFDCESTGIDPLTARILQAAIVLDDPGPPAKQDARTFLINPGVPIPAEASAIHGITAEKLKDAWPSRQAIPCIAEALHATAVITGYPLVVFNAAYDWPLLLAAIRRLKRTPPADFNPLFLDPLVIDRAQDRYRRGSRKLEAVAAFYHVPLDSAHDALADAKAAIGIMRALVAAYPELRNDTLEQLQEVQTKWYAEWRDHLNEYWESIGKADRVTGSWPIGEW